ncbi:hypothetical protein PBY51_014530 [Eleginops maclovinus]|uniref:Uncharacterized protein n=1 Tax=Eleginops maclovinus TaxID=56733 RepID=A0AAN7WWW3_ELEMC|nr:hypothetical protein PBY51_014530 [Eleginops maclovinus]
MLNAPLTLPAIRYAEKQNPRQPHQQLGEICSLRSSGAARPCAAVITCSRQKAVSTAHTDPAGGREEGLPLATGCTSPQIVSGNSREMWEVTE